METGFTVQYPQQKISKQIMLAIRWEQDIRLQVLGLSLHRPYILFWTGRPSIIVRNLYRRHRTIPYSIGSRGVFVAISNARSNS